MTEIQRSKWKPAKISRKQHTGPSVHISIVKVRHTAKLEARALLHSQAVGSGRENRTDPATYHHRVITTGTDMVGTGRGLGVTVVGAQGWGGRRLPVSAGSSNRRSLGWESNLLM